MLEGYKLSAKKTILNGEYPYLNEVWLYKQGEHYCFKRQSHSVCPSGYFLIMDFSVACHLSKHPSI